MIILPILTTSLTHFSSKGWGNVRFELGSERVCVKRTAWDYLHHEAAWLDSNGIGEVVNPMHCHDEFKRIAAFPRTRFQPELCRESRDTQCVNCCPTRGNNWRASGLVSRRLAPQARALLRHPWRKNPQVYNNQSERRYTLWSLMWPFFTSNQHILAADWAIRNYREENMSSWFGCGKTARVKWTLLLSPAKPSI